MLKEPTFFVFGRHLFSSVLVSVKTFRIEGLGFWFRVNGPCIMSRMTIKLCWLHSKHRAGMSWASANS